MKPEPDIEINGARLTDGQAMTVRCAIEHFARCLIENGLGDDAHGKCMTANYLRCVDEIRKEMVREGQR